MSIKLFSSFLDALKPVGFRIGVTGTPHQHRTRKRRPGVPKLRYPYWYMKKESNIFNERLTQENEEFIQEVINDRYNTGSVDGACGVNSPLKKEPPIRNKWQPEYRRTGLIAVNIGIIPQWLKNGQAIYTTLLQVVDNHVIKYIPPGEGKDLRHYTNRKLNAHYGNLVVGAISADPQKFTKEYCGLFAKSGVMPKKILTKFHVSPEAEILPGTPLYAAHFRPGDWVDVTGQTKYKGFQGVMKRWGFHGMPASHGVTKTHRRPGNIGGGGEKGRVWPGKKMPGHVGYRTVTSRGMQILRINYRYNVLYVRGQGIPGAVNSIVYVHDTNLPRKRSKTEQPFPTYYPEDSELELPEEVFHESLFNFDDETIAYQAEKQSKAKKRAQ